ncbi:MAG: acyl carrier protein [Clostridia bacterium]|nr:acyl carrier protein [Clostridia bacterium]
MLEQLKTLICQFVDVEPDAITEDSVLRKDLGLNSFDLVSVTTAAEAVFGVTIPDSKLGAFKTVGDVLGFIEAARKA